jgi:hypothetical protein
MDGYWEEGFRVQGEWNDHEHREGGSPWGVENTI